MKNFFVVLCCFCTVAVHASSDVRLTGTWSYNLNGETVKVTGDHIENFSSGGQTGTLQIKLYLTEEKYQGGGIHGYVALNNRYEPLVAGESYNDVSVTQDYPNTIPPGTYYVTLVLLNYIDGQFYVTDYRNFDGLATVRYADPEPVVENPPVSKTTTMTIRVTNRNVTSGDVPAISTSADGTNSVTVPLNSSVEFTVDINNPYIYLWTCDGPCIWKAFRVPVTTGGFIDYDVSDPMKRSLSFLRIR
jgi:hypothetical protein